MRKRLFLSTLVISAIVLTVFGVIGAVTVDLWYSNTLVGELKRELSLVMGGLPAAGEMDDYAKATAAELSIDGNDVRITVIDGSGVVQGDSSADFRTMENHKDRPEVALAYRDGWGSSQRYSATLRVRMLYVAVYDAGRSIAVRAARPMTEINRIYLILAGFLLAGFLVSLALAAALARRTAGVNAKPVEALVGMTRAIAAGDYAVDAPAVREPEFSELASGLKDLARSLRAHVEALERNNAQLSTVISSINEGLLAVDGEGCLLFINDAARAMLALDGAEDLLGKKLHAAVPYRPLFGLADQCLKSRDTASVELNLPGGLLARASASPMRGPVAGCIVLLVDVTQLRKLETMRRDFVANVTHELRTPLTSIRGYVESLQGGALADRDLAPRFLQIIEIEAERLSNLIGDLLYLSEIESVEHDRGIQRFPLADVVHEVMDTVEPSAAARGVIVSSDVDGGLQVHANADRIRQMLINLVDNAVKYNREGGSVHVSAEQAHGLVRIHVRDTGIGISGEHASRIFERFYRVDKGRSRSMGGTGLGLSIVKHIVELYHGNIRLSSEPGKGSEFVIELPLNE